jgi:SHS2 domain-containing protein
MNARAYREIDHSGDVGIEAWGKTPARLFENATLGLLSLVATGPVGVSVKRELVVHAERPSDLLVAWLGEVILAAATHGEVYSGVRVDVIDDCNVRGVVAGERIDTARHALRFDVKAATYHGLVFEETDDGYHARVIFDL